MAFFYDAYGYKCIFSYSFCNMKSSFLKTLFTIVLIGALPLISYGATGDASSTSTELTSSGETESPLILDSITVQDDMHVLVSFNQSIVVEAVRVRITKQSDGSVMKIDKVTSVVDAPKSVLVALSDVLEEWATYTLTVMSAISEGGVVIKEGADALKEFTAPAPLKKSLVTFNAPSNPNAVIAVVATGSTPTATASGKASTTPTTDVKELPLTGMNPIIFLIIAGGLALLLISRRKA